MSPALWISAWISFVIGVFFSLAWSRFYGALFHGAPFIDKGQHPELVEGKVLEKGGDSYGRIVGEI